MFTDFDPTVSAMFRMMFILIVGEFAAVYGFISLGRANSFVDEFVPSAVDVVTTTTT